MYGECFSTECIWLRASNVFKRKPAQELHQSISGLKKGLLLKCFPYFSQKISYVMFESSDFLNLTCCFEFTKSLFSYMTKYIVSAF